MGEKGLFQKRIHKIAISIEPFSWEPGSAPKADYEQLYKDLDEIVSNAKKEFPSNPIIEAINLYKKLKNHTKEEHQILIKEHLKNCNLEQFTLENIEWFEKWFSDG